MCIIRLTTVPTRMVAMAPALFGHWLLHHCTQERVRVAVLRKEEAVFNMRRRTMLLCQVLVIGDH